MTAALQAIEGASLAVPPLLANLLADIPLAALSFAWMAYLGGSIALVPAAGAGLVCLAGLIAHASAAKAASQAYALGSRRTGMIEEAVAQREAIRALGAARSLGKVWDEICDEAGFAAFRQRFAPQSAAQFAARIKEGTFAATLCWGAAMAGSGSLSTGALVACALLSVRAVAPFQAALGSWLAAVPFREGLAQASRLAAMPQKKPAMKRAANKWRFPVR